MSEELLLETRVPPWVQVWADINHGNVEIIEMANPIITGVPPADINPGNVEIIEMTNPIITGMASVDQPIEERLHESVFLLRRCLPEKVVRSLEMSVVNTFPAIQATHRKRHKRHAALSFHRVRESIAAKIISYHFIEGKHNPADVLSKHWAHNDV